ncbi:hypothetical protein EVB41_054 [Rhizobium phage RHph_TM3_14A]|nr:hypothetical protein EVB29_054 [Rhizobium phage RHph_TM27A]QIG66974.1 hypothetical protein EVB30_054 [Rhizobium phage RHph_TM27B]QIG67063.1 hypothetical protein EVB31_053 [Rhizobium phage RHph_TM29]QIG67519.1 hypothetical protein EVB41_054 [Rhizobium phage RHph_TM3_14A]
MRTYTLELRADFDNDEKYELVLEMVREKARELLAAALMLKDRREPEIALSHGDMFERNKDLQIFKPEEMAGGE